VLDLPERRHRQAELVLAQASTLGVDPLDYCAYRLGLGDAVVLERAAHWAGFAFSPVVPRRVAVAGIQRLDHLADIRTLRTVLFERGITFCAPRLDELLRLARARLDNDRLARHLCIVPRRAIRAQLARSSSAALLAEARQRLTRRWPYASANIDLPVPVRVGFVAILILATAAVAAAPFYLSALLLPFVAALFVVPSMIRMAAALFTGPAPAKLPLLPDDRLPVYSVLIPLRDEAALVPLLWRAMSALDYPAEKLSVMFVVEESSTDTIAAVETILDDPRFELIRIPDAAPHTKPKALNYALPLARGEHLVVFDAEDIPDPGQLRLAASQFAADPGLDCIQAELVIDNAEENWITALFAAEYAGLFGLLLPMLARLRAPMPLGGTSNHFRTAALREVGHWDAYNVTEDADLGVRLSRLRYRTGMLASETYEEAPITLDAWMVQRTRWLKGWMQTFIVHNRSLKRFVADIGWRNFIFFEIYVGSLIVSSLLHTVFLASLVVRGLVGLWPNIDNPVDVAYVTVLVVGYGGTCLLVIAGLARRRAFHLMPYQLLLPVYWIMHSIAALRAAHQLLVRPYFWGKTAHGRTRRPRRYGTSGQR
jgi:cellulose synthase/poly-beta-1,6-N-acetylglucosamine synthase-like glycosyltransferase